MSAEPPSSGRPTGPPSGPLSGSSRPPSGPPPAQPPGAGAGPGGPHGPWWKSVPRVAALSAAVALRPRRLRQGQRGAGSRGRGARPLRRHPEHSLLRCRETDQGSAGRTGQEQGVRLRGRRPALRRARLPALADPGPAARRHPGHQPRLPRRRRHRLPVGAPGGHRRAGGRPRCAPGALRLRQPAGIAGGPEGHTETGGHPLVVVPALERGGGDARAEGRRRLRALRRPPPRLDPPAARRPRRPARPARQAAGVPAPLEPAGAVPALAG